MTKNIAVALNAGTPEQRNAITSFFSSQKFAFWHWIDDFWIVQVPEPTTPKSLYALLLALDKINDPTILIFEFKGQVKYWGKADPAAWKWLNHIGGVE